MKKNVIRNSIFGREADKANKGEIIRETSKEIVLKTLKKGYHINKAFWIKTEEALEEEEGGIDIDRLVTEVPKRMRNQIRTIETIIQDISNKREDRTASFDDIIANADLKGSKRIHGKANHN